jgi:hypothetical protein
MKIYTCYTPTHAKMFEQHFLTTLPKEFRKANLVAKKLAQRSKSGAFASDGFARTCLDKVAVIVQACKTERRPFVFSDVDVRFYQRCGADLLKQLGDLDMAFQWDGPTGGLCTGFFVVKPSPAVTAFWEAVHAHMKRFRMMDQDAVNQMLKQDGIGGKLKVGQLPRRYWTFGQNDYHWVPGMPVAPPDDLAVHHGNWTKGIKNKLALLGEVQAAMDAKRRAGAQHGIERNPEGATAAMAKLLDLQRAQIRCKHHPLPMALVLQFWRRDEAMAYRLARMLTDIEPEFRDDVGFFFARQSNVKPASENRELWETMLYVGKKFPVTELETFVDESKPYPGVAFDPWASACEKLSTMFYTGTMRYRCGFMFEADGCPIGSDWIDRLKRAHEETMLAGKQVTGPLMRFGGVDRLHPVGGHINGTMILNWSFWEDHPSLRRCPPSDAWDVFHGDVFTRESRFSDIILNLHGAQGLSESLYWIFAKESCWLTSIKDGSHHHWCQRYIDKMRG